MEQSTLNRVLTAENSYVTGTERLPNSFFFVPAGTRKQQKNLNTCKFIRLVLLIYSDYIFMRAVFLKQTRSVPIFYKFVP